MLFRSQDKSDLAYYLTVLSQSTMGQDKSGALAAPVINLDGKPMYRDNSRVYSYEQLGVDNYIYILVPNSYGNCVTKILTEAGQAFIEKPWGGDNSSSFRVNVESSASARLTVIENVKVGFEKS